MRTLVLQSFRSSDVPEWIQRCLASVQLWTAQQNFEYRLLGDELFAELPTNYRHKVGDRLPIAADLARLLWIRKLLARESYARVLWLDADVFIFAPQLLTLRMADTCVFGYEHWLQQTRGRYRIHKNVHNAFAGFQNDCPVLPFLIHATQRLVERIDGVRMPPQFVGPKLLTNLHNTVGFDLERGVGAISPDLHEALLEDNQAALRVYRQSTPAPLFAANLSLSVADSTRMHALMDYLLERNEGLIV